MGESIGGTLPLALAGGTTGASLPKAPVHDKPVAGRHPRSPRRRIPFDGCAQPDDRDPVFECADRSSAAVHDVEEVPCLVDEEVVPRLNARELRCHPRAARRRPHPQLARHEVPGDRPFCAGDLDVMCLRSAPVVEPNMGGDIGAGTAGGHRPLRQRRARAVRRWSTQRAPPERRRTTIADSRRDGRSCGGLRHRARERRRSSLRQSSHGCHEGRYSPQKTSAWSGRPMAFRSRSSRILCRAGWKRNWKPTSTSPRLDSSASASRSRPSTEWETGFSRRTWQPASRHAVADVACALVGFAMTANVGASSRSASSRSA